MNPIVEVKGVAFPNKGAEMLLVSCLQQLEKRCLYAALEPYSPFEHKLRYPLFTKTRIHRHGLNILGLFNLLPLFARERLGFVRPREISLILDASGFAYGDPWPPSLARERLLGESLSCPVVLLPQSFGEFSNPAQKRVAKALQDKASLIFAREPEGAENLFRATGRRPPVVPDITFGMHVAPDKSRHDILIIPNFQVEKRHGDAYADTLVEAARQLLVSGREVTLLNHEGPKDLAICHRVRDRLAAGGRKVAVLDPVTGSEAKSIIGAASFVVSSRYHGLIAALSQGVPCYPLGWSYKYVAAMRLFGIEIKDSIGCPEHVSDRALSAGYCGLFSNADYVGRLDEVQADVASMWASIFDLMPS